MGKLIHGAIRREISIGDRTLAHDEAVLLYQLRRNSAFGLRSSPGSDVVTAPL